MWIRMSLSTYSAQKLQVDSKQQEDEDELVHHVQGEHYQRKVLRVWVIVTGPVGNPE